LEAQNGYCTICGTENLGTTHQDNQYLFVDRYHSTGHIRGLLCNRVLGYFAIIQNFLKKPLITLDYMQENKLHRNRASGSHDLGD